MRFLRIIFRGVFLAAFIALAGLLVLLLRRLSAKSRAASPPRRDDPRRDREVIEVTATEVASEPPPR